MLLRFRSRDGQFRLDVSPSDIFPVLIPLLAEKLPPTVDLSTLELSNKPHGGENRRIANLKGVTFGAVGLKYV